MSIRQTLRSTFRIVSTAVKTGWSLQPWKSPSLRRDEMKLLASLEQDIQQEHPEVPEGLKVLRMRDANYRALSTTVLGMYGLSVTLTVLIAVQSAQAASIFGIAAGIVVCFASALVTGLNRLREVTLPPTEARLHAWSQLLGVLLVLASLGLLFSSL